MVLIMASLSRHELNLPELTSYHDDSDSGQESKEKRVKAKTLESEDDNSESEPLPQSDDSHHSDKETSTKREPKCKECGAEFHCYGNVIHHWCESCLKNTNRKVPKKVKSKKDDSTPKKRKSKKAVAQDDVEPSDDSSPSSHEKKPQKNVKSTSSPKLVLDKIIINSDEPVIVVPKAKISEPIAHCSQIKASKSLYIDMPVIDTTSPVKVDKSNIVPTTSSVSMASSSISTVKAKLQAMVDKGPIVIDPTVRKLGKTEKPYMPSSKKVSDKETTSIQISKLASEDEIKQIVRYVRYAT